MVGTAKGRAKGIGQNNIDSVNGLKQSGKLQDITILHLSDLHFGRRNRFNGENPRNLAKRHAAALKDGFIGASLPPTINLVIITGDVGEGGRKEDYDSALLFFKTLQKELGLPPSHFVFCPGNHDVSWSECNAVAGQWQFDEGNDWSTADGQSKEDLRQRMHEVKFHHFYQFLRDFYGRGPDDVAPPRGGGARIHDFPLLGVSVAALDTCRRESHLEHGGHLGYEQADAVLEHWQQGEAVQWIKVVVLHHNPTKIPDFEVWKERASRAGLSGARFKHAISDAAGFDASNLEHIVKHANVQLVLHGHHHSRTSSLMTWAGGGHASVLAAGSWGAPDDQRPDGEPNRFQVVRLEITGDEPHVINWLLEFDPKAEDPGTTRPGRYLLGNAERQRLHLPKGFMRIEPRARTDADGETASDLLDLYREAMAPLFSRWEFANVGMFARNSSGQPINAGLDDMYVPLRFASNKIQKLLDIGQIDANNSESSEYILPKSLLSRATPLALRGPAGSGKTTWMQWTFRQLLGLEGVLPVFVELRTLVHFWDIKKPEGADRTILSHIEKWIETKLPGWGKQVRQLIEANAGPRPVLLVDGWDELGSHAREVREQLASLHRLYPRILFVVSSRPEGEGIPSDVEGFADVVDVQRLNDKEVSGLARNFFVHCYGLDTTRVGRETEAFMTRLERVPEAAAFARVPLLLAMLLFASRERPLPESRHELYELCVEELLAHRPNQRRVGGAQLPAHYRPPTDHEEARRLLAAMAFKAQDASDAQNTDASPQHHNIVLLASEWGRWLPHDWEPGKKEGFIAWVCGETGIMTQRSDGRIQFMHRSFQEYLAAWRMVTLFEGKENQVDACLKRVGNKAWWETLRLWAALLNMREPERVSQLAMSLLDRKDDALGFVGALFADGLATDDVLADWGDCLGLTLRDSWPNWAQECANAWGAASSLDDRRALLAEILGPHAERATWMAWLRLSSWQNDARLPELSAPRKGTNARVMLDAIQNGITDEQSVAVARGLVGLVPFWPGHPISIVLLNLWPSPRRLAGIRLQVVASLLDLEATQLAATEILRPLPHVVSKHARSWAGGWARDLMHDWAPNIERDWVSELARDLARVTIRDLSRDWIRDMPRYWARGWVRVPAHDLARDWARGWVRSWVRIPARDSTDNLARNLARESARDLARRSTRGWTRGWARDHQLHDYSAAAVDSGALILESWWRNALRGALAHINIKEAPPLLAIFHYACRISLAKSNDKEKVTQLVANLDAAIVNYCQGPEAHDLWIALARWIARRPERGDGKLLEMLAREPDSDPTLDDATRWGLRYIVRGDIAFDDGQVVTLDKLAQGVRKGGGKVLDLPYLEELPPDIQIHIK